MDLTTHVKIPLFTIISSRLSFMVAGFEPAETDTNCPLVFESMDNVSDAPNSSDDELSDVPPASALFAFANDSSTSIRVGL